VIEIMPVQQLACATTIARGHDRDAPRGSAEVTATPPV
jgi:glucosamine 6-phosphate synthetase-like amidotransferase/phosphosugar isomerase protein